MNPVAAAQRNTDPRTDAWNAAEWGQKDGWLTCADGEQAQLCAHSDKDLERAELV